MEIATPPVYPAAREAGFTGPIISGCHGNVPLWLASIEGRPDALVAVSEHLVERASEAGLGPSLQPTVIANPVSLARMERASRPARLSSRPGGGWWHSSGG